MAMLLEWLHSLVLVQRGVDDGEPWSASKTGDRPSPVDGFICVVDGWFTS